MHRRIVSGSVLGSAVKGAVTYYLCLKKCPLSQPYATTHWHLGGTDLAFRDLTSGCDSGMKLFNRCREMMLSS